MYIYINYLSSLKNRISSVYCWRSLSVCFATFISRRFCWPSKTSVSSEADNPTLLYCWILSNSLSQKASLMNSFARSGLSRYHLRVPSCVGCELVPDWRCSMKRKRAQTYSHRASSTVQIGCYFVENTPVRPDVPLCALFNCVVVLKYMSLSELIFISKSA